MSDTLELINRRQRQILVHSFLYYQLNENIIDDTTYDAWSKELAELMDLPESENSIYYEVFKGFDGSSGYHLPYSLPEIQHVGYRLLRTRRKL